MSEMEQRWREWEALPYPAAEYPPGSSHSEVFGVDLAQADGDAAAVFHQFFSGGTLHATELALLDVLLDTLPKAVPHLHGEARGYFGEALLLLRDVDAAVRVDDR